MILASALMFVLGGGVAHYLGADFLPLDFWLGLLWVMSINITGNLLILNFSHPTNSIKKKEINIVFGQKKISILQLAMLFFSFSGVYLAILIVNQKVTIFIGALIALTMLGLVVFAIPPFNLSKKGYQEIGLAIYQGCLIPAFGFFILASNFHRLLFLIVFPMTFLALAFYIALNFSTFANDQKIGRKSFVQLLTWQRASPIHHVMIISGYLFFLFGYGLGIPLSIFRVVLLTIPLAGFQIFWLQRIVQGGKPMWDFFNVLSASVYGLSAYLIAYSLWIH